MPDPRHSDDEPTLLDLWWEHRMRDAAIREQEEADERNREPSEPTETSR